MSASGESRAEGGDGGRVDFLYAGQAISEVPRDVTHARVDPSVKKIGKRAFEDCKRLEAVELHDGLEEIGEYAFGELFAGCTSLKRVRIPPAVKKIGKGAFGHCERLEELELCEGLEEIGASAFGGCKSLKRVRIPPTVKRIDWRAFGFCERLEELEICDGLWDIGRDAFYRCTSLKHVRIPPTVKRIGQNAFWLCKQLEEVLLYEGIEEVGEYAFAGCSSLKRVRIPPAVKRIGKKAFDSCHQLEGVELCEGLEEVGECAFNGCISLHRVLIPPTVNNIGEWAFQNCVNLEEVDLCEGLASIGKKAFARCTSLRHITSPSSLKFLREEAFQGCHKLEKLYLREGLEQIGESAFHDCRSLRRVRIPSTVKKIGRRAFGGSIHLVSVELSDGLEEIGKLAFENCFSLRNVSVPSTVKIMGGDALRGCHDIQRLLGTNNESTTTLKCRLDGLPLHQLCYDQSCRPSQHIFEHLQNMVSTMSDQVEASIPNESSPIQKKGNGKRAVTWSESGPKTKVRYLGATGSDTTNENALPSGTSCFPLNPHYKIHASRDCLGMTPLHILACSTKQNLNLYQFIIANQPKCLITKDKWGCLPIFYAIWGGVALEIVQFLIDSQKSAFPDIELNWDMMISTLCRAEASLDVIQMLLGIQQSSFPEQSIDIRRVARELTILCLVGCDPGCDSFGEDFHSSWEAMMEVFSNSSAYQGIVQSLLEIQQSFFSDQRSINWQAVCEEFVKPLKGWWRASYNPFQFLVRCNISQRLDAIRVEKWRMDVKYSLTRIASRRYWHSTTNTTVATHFDDFHSKLIFYECEFHQLKESTFLLELALWKCRIGESIATQCKNVGPDGELDELAADPKRQCRINSGAAIIIPNILPYLIVEKEIVSGIDVDLC